MFNDNQDINDINGTVARDSGCGTLSGRRRVSSSQQKQKTH